MPLVTKLNNLMREEMNFVWSRALSACQRYVEALGVISNTRDCVGESSKAVCQKVSSGLTFTTSTSRSSSILHVLPTENAPLQLNLALWM